MSIFTKATLGFSDNRITFNDTTTDPYYRAEARAPQHFQIRSDDIPIPYESGVADYNTLVGETTYVIQGTMYPRSQSTYDTGLNALRDVANVELSQTDVNQGTLFSNNGYVPYSWGDASGVLSKQLFVKPLYVMATESTRQGYVVPFKLICKVKDPTIYGGTLKTASTAQGTPGASSGSGVFAFAFPVNFGATYYTVSAAAINNGTVPSYPQSIDVYGPVTTPIVTNTRTGEFIKVNVTLSSPSDHLQIQYGKDYLSVTLNGVNNLKNVSSDSTYFKVKVGGNNISLSGSSISSGSYATLNYYDAFSLA